MAPRSVLLARTQARALARRQRGFGGFLVIALIAGMAAAAGMFAFYRTDTVQARVDRATTDVLAGAKEALIGYAVRRGGPTGTARPGELPCPDFDGDGIEGYVIQQTVPPVTCAAGAIGQVPWRTLGIPEPKDAAGETLWYAVSGAFRARTAGNNATLNSDARGNLIVLAADGVTELTDVAAAVVIAPGAALANQNRRNTGAGLTCGLLGTILPKFCPTNYFDTHPSGTSNVPSTTRGPFVAGAASPTFNDRLIYLTASEIMPAVEMRVGTELKKLLETYRANSDCKCYPWADNWPYSGGIADTGQNRGRFASLPEESWASVGAALPEWLPQNDWHNLFWYSVARRHSDQEASFNRRCKTCSDHQMLRVTETVTGVVTWASALLFTPGPPLDGIARLSPPKGQSNRTDNIELYVEDAENRDAASSKSCPDVGEIGDANPPSSNLKGALSCDEYVAPRARGVNRDRIFMVGVAAPGQCATQSQALASNLTCAIGGGAVKTSCQAAVNNLNVCTCYEAAAEMLDTPCRNSLNPPQCQAALAQLQTCNQ